MAFNARNFTRNAVILTVGGGLTAAWIVNGVIPNVRPKNFDVVEPGKVYRSGVLTSAAMKKVVEENEIKLVIDLGAHHAGSKSEEREAQAVKVLGVDRVQLRLFGDGTGDPNEYVEALRLMKATEGAALVHCAAGAQRTGVAVVLYRMIEDGWTMETALAEAERYGHDPQDNTALRPYLERWAEPIMVSLRTGEPIPYDGPTPESGASVGP